MRKKYKSGLGLHACLGLMLAVFGCFLTAGCERDRWDHKPPSGQGSIIVDNRTSNGIYVYLDGYYTNRVSSFDHETYDLNPAVRRVVLDQTNGQPSAFPSVSMADQIQPPTFGKSHGASIFHQT